MTRTLRGVPRVAPVAALVLSGFLTACGGSEKPAQSPTPQSQSELSSEAERYFPLKDNTVLAFVTAGDSPKDTGLLVMAISRTGPARAKLTVAGRSQELQLLPTGIRHRDGGFVLRLPLQVGAQWRGLAGMVTIEAIDQTVKVPAGEFFGCLQTVEDAGDAENGKRIATTYCPYVGIVSLDIHAFSGSTLVVEHARLKSHGPRVDLSDIK